MKSLNEALLTAQSLLFAFRTDDDNITRIMELTDVLISAFNANRNILVCGNGGSHADSLHFAEELTGKARKPRKPLGAIALGEGTHVTCTGNDFGFDSIFERQVHAIGKPGDVLVVLSTSGNSPNLIKAAIAAKAQGMFVIGLLGNEGGRVRHFVDGSLLFPGQTSDRIQELQMLVLHSIVEQIERKMFPENYL